MRFVDAQVLPRQGGEKIETRLVRSERRQNNVVLFQLLCSLWKGDVRVGPVVDENSFERTPKLGFGKELVQLGVPIPKDGVWQDNESLNFWRLGQR